MLVRYKCLDDGQGNDFYFERSLDLIFSPGAFLVEIDHTGVKVGLPTEFCGGEHYIVGTLIVTDSGNAGATQKDRITGQVLMFTDRESKDTKLYTRTFVGGEWSEWRGLAFTGMYDSISTTEELVATVKDLSLNMGIILGETDGSINYLQQIVETSFNPLGLSTTIGIEDFIAFYIEDGVPHEIGIKQIRKDYGRISVYDSTMNLAITVNGGSEGDNPTGVKEYWAKGFVNKTVDGVEKPFYAVYYVRVNWDVVKDVAFVSDNASITECFILQPVPVALSVAGSNLLDMLQSLDYDIVGVEKNNSDGIPERLKVVWRDGTVDTAIYSDYRADVLEYATLNVDYNSFVKVVQEREFSEMGDITKKTTIIKNK